MISAIGNTPILNTCFCAPVRWTSDKVRQIAEAIFGYLLRIITFQLGEMKVRGAYLIMRIYQRFSSDPREERPFDSQRLEQSKSFLAQFGGVESVVRSADGGAEIRLTTFKSEDFFNAFRARGSLPIDITHEGRSRRALLDVSENDAAKFYLPMIDIRMPDGTMRRGALLAESVPPGPSPHILHCHSPGRSKDMDRRLVGQLLGAGCDLTIWDPRGTVDSTGVASEGGYYLDADAVFQQIQQNTPTNRIYVSGFCEGAAMAVYLKRRYHHLGIHLIASNPYTSMRDVVKGYGLLGWFGVRYGLKALQDPSIAVPQDCFDNVEKLRNLPRSEGKAIFIHTDTDRMMPRGTVQKLIEAYNNAGPVHEILRIHPNPKENGHLQPPYEDPIIWRRLAPLLV